MCTYIMTKFKIFASYFIQITIFIMSISPESAISNIAKWLLFFGIEQNSIPVWLYNPSINYIMYFLCCLIALHWLLIIIAKIKTKTITQPAIPQQSDYNSFQKYTGSILRDVKKFQKRINNSKK